MCLIVIAREAHPDYKMIIAANRDEFYARPSAPAAWWQDHPEIFAGRDLQEGGTWLGVTKTGRFAALTNYRDPSALRASAPTRGSLTRNFLLARESAEQHFNQLAQISARYNAFNLLAWDGAALTVYASRAGYYQEVISTISAISNQELDTPWPKVVSAKRSMENIVKRRGELEREAVFDLLRDRSQPPDAALPDTGVGLPTERELAPIFIARPGYGTRCSTLVTIAHGGAIEFEERSYDSAARVTHIARERIVL